MSPLNETTISSLDLTVITPQTPRREKNKGINKTNYKNYTSNKNDDYKKESRHCRGCCGGKGDGDGNDGGRVDGFGEVDVDYLHKFKRADARSTVSAATSPFKFDCGCSPFNDFKFGSAEAGCSSGRKVHEHCRFKKKEKISDFGDFFELLSEWLYIFCYIFFNLLSNF